jgi:N-acetylglutamate synthase-like GNAT family acetyltransferase
VSTATAVEIAGREEWPAIEALLRAAGLSDAAVDEAAAWLVVRGDGRIVGTAGVETYGDVGLLRSVAVDPIVRGSGVGASLVAAAVDRARERGLSDLYLLTETADRWFPRFGFKPVERSGLPPAIAGCRQATEACAGTAVAMRLSLRAER